MSVTKIEPSRRTARFSRNEPAGNVAIVVYLGWGEGSVPTICSGGGGGAGAEAEEDIFQQDWEKREIQAVADSVEDLGSEGGMIRGRKIPWE